MEGKLELEDIFVTHIFKNSKKDLSGYFTKQNIQKVNKKVIQPQLVAEKCKTGSNVIKD